MSTRCSLTPCLDEDRIDEGICRESLKEIELSDISEDDNWPMQDPQQKLNRNGNGNNNELYEFKKITKSSRDRNYRDKRDHKDFASKRSSSSSKRTEIIQRKKEIERYDVRKVIACKDFSISRSRSRSSSPRPTTSRYRSSFSPRRRGDVYNRTPQSPISISRKRPKQQHQQQHSLTPERYRSYQKYKSPPISEEMTHARRSRSRHKHNKSKTLALDHECKRKKHRHSKKSHSASVEHSLSPSRQIKNVISSNLAQENIKVILKNDDVKRQRSKKRDKKSKKEKTLKKKISKEQLQKKEVFASGDNILISVCFNNNNNNNNSKSSIIDDKSKDTATLLDDDGKISGKKLKKRQSSPSSSISSNNSYSRNEQKKYQRKHKRKKLRSNRKERSISKEPKTPPPLPPPLNSTPTKSVITKRKNDSKPIAIIDLEKSPGKEIIQSPKEVIVLSDSDGNGEDLKKKTMKDIIIVEDVTIIEKSDEIEEPPMNSSNTNANNLTTSTTTIMSNESNKILKEQQETVNTFSNNDKDDKLLSNQPQNEAYDPFEPTKSRSISPMTPPPPHISSDIFKNKIDSLGEKVQKDSSHNSTSIDDHQGFTAAIWTRKDYDGKRLSSQQSSSTPSMPQNYKQPTLPSPSVRMKSNNNKTLDDDDDDDRTPYSPSSDGFDYEPVQQNMHSSGNKVIFDNVKHSDIDTQSSEPSGSFSFTADDTTTSKSTPLKLTASTLKTFNSTMRSTGPVGLNYVSKAELSIFENYLPPSHHQKSPLQKRQATTNAFIRSKINRFSKNINENPPVIDESLLFDEEVPNSAVDLVNKDRFLKKSLRIERVAEEVKLVLKPHYNKKHITKDEYKMILRKSVPKICHNKTGEINISKITQLIEAYIKKFRYKRKAGTSGIASSI